MKLFGTRLAAVGLLGSALLLGACGYDDAVYGGASVGYGSPAYGGYGYGYGGWYEDYYYPGSGYYVFDRAGARYRWSDRQRTYWQSHRGDRGGWHGGPRRGNRDYDGKRWRRGGDQGPVTVDRGNRPPRPEGQGNWRGGGRRDGGRREGAVSPTPNPQGQGYRGGGFRGGGGDRPAVSRPAPQVRERPSGNFGSPRARPSGTSRRNDQ